jgi:hypothetical protein
MGIDTNFLRRGGFLSRLSSLPTWDPTVALLEQFDRTFHRPFPTGLLPAGPLYAVRRDRRLPARLRAAVRALRTGGPREELDAYLLIGSKVARSRKDLSAADFREFPMGYFLVGFWGKRLGNHGFYYARRDDWSCVSFRFRHGANMGASAFARIPDFLTSFEELCRAVRPRTRWLLAFEKDGLYGKYDITTMDGAAYYCDCSPFDTLEQCSRVAEFTKLAKDVMAARTL